MRGFTWVFILASFICIFFMSSCSSDQKVKPVATLMTLEPGHFHAALVQKVMYPDVNPKAYVYAPEGPEVADYLNRVWGYNERAEDPTSWIVERYTGPDFFERMLSEKPGNVLVLAGNNQKKTEYILKAVENGIHVFSDKPMAINSPDFELLKQAYAMAEKKGLLLYDIMTERFEITSLLQKELCQMPEIFGELEEGSLEHPSVIKESVHHFFKYVSGTKLKRPPWFFDVEQEGDGIVDVTTHLADLIQWACFPEVVLDYQNDIQMLQANRWPTVLTQAEFSEVTQTEGIPDFLKKDLSPEGDLLVYSNGAMTYRLKNIHARVQVEWKYRAESGRGDTHYSLMRGSKANLEIRQGEAENFVPELYLIPSIADQDSAALERAFAPLVEKYPGVRIEKAAAEYKISIPEVYRVGHEAHFGQVTALFLEYLKDGKLPDWEVPNILAKYYTTTAGYELAKKQQ